MSVKITLNYKEVCDLWAFVQENKPPKFDEFDMIISIEQDRESGIGATEIVTIKNFNKPKQVIKDITDYDSW